MAYGTRWGGLSCRSWEDASRLLARAYNWRGSDRVKLANNTYLERRWGPDPAKADIAVRLHGTDVVTYHHDGSFTLRANGWHSVTTSARIRWYSNAHVYSAQRSGGTWCVFYGDDEPIVFRDGIRCNRSGRVMHQRKETTLAKSGAVERERARTRDARREASRRAREVAKLRAARQAGTDRLLAALGVEPDKVRYKGVTQELRSPTRRQDGLTYAPGTWVVADGFDPSDTECSQGIHFCRTIAQAEEWYSGGKVVAVIPEGAIHEGRTKQRAAAVFVLAVV